MKKLLALLLALAMLLCLAACSDTSTADPEEQSAIELSLWTYPAGD